MTEEEYKEMVYDIYRESFKKIIEYHESLVKFKVGDFMYCNYSKRVYIIKSIQTDYTYLPRNHKHFSHYSCPEIRIFGTVFYLKKKEGTGNKTLLNFFYLSVPEEDYLNNLKQLHREKVNKQRAKKRKTDPMFKLQGCLRARIRYAFKVNGWKKATVTEDLLGGSFPIAKAHIQRQFTKGMTWKNHGQGEGKWHIDHIIPLSSAKTEQEMKNLCHYSNLQPMWSMENIKKGSKIPQVQTKLTI